MTSKQRTLADRVRERINRIAHELHPKARSRRPHNQASAENQSEQPATAIEQPTKSEHPPLDPTLENLQAPDEVRASAATTYVGKVEQDDDELAIRLDPRLLAQHSNMLTGE